MLKDLSNSKKYDTVGFEITKMDELERKIRSLPKEKIEELMYKTNDYLKFWKPKKEVK